MTLSEYLQNEMKTRAQNRAQFAETLGIHQTQLARLLNLDPGQVPRSSTLRNLADRLGCSENELVTLCYGNSINYAPNNQEEHKLKYGSCYELIDKSKEIRKKYTDTDQEELTTLDIAQTLCKQDEERYHPHSDYEGKPEQWQSIFEAFPESSAIFYFERNTDGKPTIEIVGDFSIVFFDVDEVGITDGTLKDSNIKIDKLHAMTIPGKCDAVILNMSLINRYNTTDYVPTLIACFKEKLQHFQKCGIEINHLYANVYARDIGLYRSLGFQKYDESAKLPEPKDEKNIPRLFKMEKVNEQDKSQDQQGV